MAIKIWAYKQASKSARALAEALGTKVLKHEGSKYKPKSTDLIINWGSSDIPSRLNVCNVLNKPDKVRLAGNKLLFFQSVNRDLCIPWTDNPEEAQSWLDDERIVIARMSLTGHSGHGILVVEPGNDLPEAPLYTRYIKKDSEWRIHVFNNQIIFEQRKIRDPDQEPTSWKIRSHANGFIFQHNNLSVPQKVRDVALQVVQEIGLDFGAVDVIYSNRYDKAWCLEVNTAPGLEGTTIQKYKEAIERL